MNHKNHEALSRIIHAIPENGTIAIFPHVGVDGDCLGSAIALRNVLESTGHPTFVFVDTTPPSRFTFMPGIEELIVYGSDRDPDAMIQKIYPDHQIDFGILIDCSNSSRIGHCNEIYEKSIQKAVIDHHKSSECTVKLCCVDPKASASGELVYDFILQLQEHHGRKLLEEKTAFNIFTAIFSDTGGFSYANTTAKAFGIANALFSSFRIDIRAVAYHLYEKTSIAKIKLEGLAYQSTFFFHHEQIAICLITRAMMDECKAVDNDVDSICSTLRNIEGIVVAFVLREKKPGEIRGNIRSSEQFDASAFAVRFNGGGHKMAAGFSIFNKEIQEAYEIVQRESIAEVIRAEELHAKNI